MHTETQRSSSISGALRALSDFHPCEIADGEPFKIRVAADRETRRRAYALAYRVYRTRGYVDNEQKLIVSDFDAEPQTLTLLAEDEHGREAATASMIVDGENGLPSDEIFGAELANWRASGRKLTEITRLAISEEHQNSRMLLLRVFNMLLIYGRRLRGADDGIIEINPRHVAFYERLLLFQQLGGERPCPRVNGAPAILMRLDYSLAERAISQQEARHRRTLYSQFYRGSEEDSAAQFMADYQRPMNSSDARSFGLAGNVSTSIA